MQRIFDQTSIGKSAEILVNGKTVSGTIQNFDNKYVELVNAKIDNATHARCVISVLQIETVTYK